MVSWGICRVWQLIVDAPIFLKGLTPEPAKPDNDTYEH